MPSAEDGGMEIDIYTTEGDIIMQCSLDELVRMNYTQFISYVGQWNVPPGSISTINEWAIFGHVNSDSRVLEIACTTGFSGRELARLTGCSVKGIDICKESIDDAIFNHQYYASECKLSYEHVDLYELKRDYKYTHIILGAAIQFFVDRDKVVEIISELLEDGGKILVSPYYLTDNHLPKELIEEARRILGIWPTDFGYETAMAYYKEFEILYQSRKDIVAETKEQMMKYTEDTVNRICEIRNIQDEDIIEVLKSRLYEIKNVCNELHKRHSYSVLVLRYTKKVFPNRFVELF